MPNHVDLKSHADHIEDLHPLMRGPVELMCASLEVAYQEGATQTYFRIFEGYRSPQRQTELFSDGRRVTKAKAWQSAHQYGLAVDMVPFTNAAFHWSESADWAFLKATARKFGLDVPFAWDRPHVQHPAFNAVRAAFRK